VTSPRPSFLSLCPAEPFRIFFPLATLLGIGTFLLPRFLRLRDVRTMAEERSASALPSLQIATLLLLARAVLRAVGDFSPERPHWLSAASYLWMLAAGVWGIYRAAQGAHRGFIGRRFLLGPRGASGDYAMKIHHLTVADAFASLKSGLEGLSDAEAQRRLAELGRNEVEEVAHEALLLTFAREFVHFFALILWIAAGLAFFAEWREPGQGMATLGFAIVGVIVINGVFSFWQAYRAEQALAVLKKLLPSATKVVRAGTVRQLPAAELVPGDVILLEPATSFPRTAGWWRRSACG
jgi:magnesium-transporting ATPase (P-type)